MRIGPQDALIIVDVQNDFLPPSGALAVPGGDTILPAVNALTNLPFGVRVATQDWHPADHCSFTAQNGRWPDHCVQGTEGAELSALLRTNGLAAILRKGMMQPVDSYSAFTDNNGQNPTGLEGYLHTRGIKRVWICGLAYDVCVADTAQDAARLGFTTYVVEDACASVETPPAQVAERLQAHGVTIVRVQDMTP
ncbi:nicotinamidase [Acetobacter cibinongensis]|uniref:nicotinamidase n=1 Tax=Acetobacter cibinongensis TaxID=146475 RepID=UPI000A37E9B5|nr:nicotinamidase [Acetobacter cibinongensis]